MLGMSRLTFVPSNNRIYIAIIVIRERISIHNKYRYGDNGSLCRNSQRGKNGSVESPLMSNRYETVELNTLID